MTNRSVEIDCIYHADCAKVYVPTIFESYVVDVSMYGFEFEIGLWDTAGQEDYDRVRPLAYPDANVIMLCFSVDNPDSLDNVHAKVSLFNELDTSNQTPTLTRYVASGSMKYCVSVKMYQECLLA